MNPVIITYSNSGYLPLSINLLLNLSQKTTNIDVRYNIIKDITKNGTIHNFQHKSCDSFQNSNHFLISDKMIG